MSKKNKTIRVKLIANPGAGKAEDTADKLKQVINLLNNNGYKADVAYAKPKEKATPIARRAVKKGYKIVIAMGGDGTIEAVMRGMIGSKARLGIIPTGTENNIARSLGIPIGLEEACTLIISDHTMKLDMGQVKTKKGEKFTFFEMATLGLSASIYPAANKLTDGKLSTIKSAAMTLINQEIRPKLFLTMNGESKIEVETMVVVISNTPTFGKNFLVAPEASLQDGQLDISVYPDFSKPELLGYYAAIMDGGYSGDKKVQHYQANKLKIKASPRLDVMADGVELGKGTVSIKLLPRALRVITNGKQAELENQKEVITSAVPESATAIAKETPVEPMPIEAALVY